jgi:hypothetical protein
MKKILVLSTLTFLLSLTFGLSKSFAGGCSAKCQFSSCTIGGCTGQYACGCYFGVAVCKCEPNTTGGGTGTGPKNTTTHKVMDGPAIQLFNDYAANSGFTGLIAVGQVLQQFNEANFDVVLESYKDQISQLNDKELELLKLYTESNH